VSAATITDSQNPVVVVGSGVLTTSTLQTSGGTVAVTYRVTDDVGCCSYHQAWMYYPNGTVVQQVTPALISGDEKNGTFRASFNVPSGAVAGSYQIKAQALDIAGKYTDLQLLGTVTVANPSGLIPTFGARTPDYYAPGFKYQISNYDASYTWSVTSTVGTATINSSGLVSVANVAAKQSATVTVTTTKIGFNTASASITSVGPWNLSDEIQTQTITATLTGTTLTVNVPNANGWNWSLIWDGAVQRTNITSFPYTVTGFSTNKNIQLSATDNLQNFGYSRVFLPTLVTPTPPATIQTSTGGTARYFAETGHYYEYVAGSKNFSDAKALAENATANGLKGYLLTVTSANEDTFARTFSTGANYHVWLGASDAALEGCWRWVNGSATDLSGPFFNKGNVPGCTVSGTWYTRWGANEPSDSFGTEDNASNNYADAWNDFTGAGDGSTNGPSGVVIEYGDRRD
jgi:hypothetical protein